ncbi:hypothetical protein C9374_001534 [Naegleria lovaniensis]|uniref:B30.2/SPRY domain-containing protein n=1 Tax=Naegleria lovaniensis TaxID=51637 RepID=A0AA88GQV5_NAELO|nr:uncharacterized protein C9374_001534 [Naegleria lovaniensis]KAG2387202.1 hypothetical protein C9374_001534 [Naegleria lovaniensis]
MASRRPFDDEMDLSDEEEDYDYNNNHMDQGGITLADLEDDDDDEEEQDAFPMIRDPIPLFLNQFVPNTYLNNNNIAMSDDHASRSKNNNFNYFLYRCGSIDLFQKKTAQLGFPLRIILSSIDQKNSATYQTIINNNNPFTNKTLDTTMITNDLDSPMTPNTANLRKSFEQLPSVLLETYMLHLMPNGVQDLDYDNMIKGALLGIAEKLDERERRFSNLLIPIVHYFSVEGAGPVYFGWQQSTSHEYEHCAKNTPNSQQQQHDPSFTEAPTFNFTPNISTLTVANVTEQKEPTLENIPSVLRIEKPTNTRPIEYYFNKRICIQLHPYLCLQIIPSELRRKSNYNISQSKSSKYEGYYFYCEYTVLDSGYSNMYGSDGVCEIGCGMAPFEYSEGMVGWYRKSVGYHCDCGRVYDNMPENTDNNFAGKGNVGDTLGVAWSLKTGEITFVKNGVVVETRKRQQVWKKDFWEDDFRRFCPTISFDYNKRKLYVNVGLNRALYPFKYYLFNTYEEQEIMFSYLDVESDSAEGQYFVDISFKTFC